MATESKDLAILMALTEHLEGIVPINNPFGLDLTGRVFRGRTRFGDSDPAPMLNILEAPRTEDALSFVGDLKQKRLERWTLLLQGWVDDDKTNPADPAYRLKSVVENRLARLTLINPNSAGKPTYPDEYLLGRRVVNIQIGPGIVSPPRENISSRAFFYLPLAIDRSYDPNDVFVDL